MERKSLGKPLIQHSCFQYEICQLHATIREVKLAVQMSGKEGARAFTGPKWRKRFESKRNVLTKLNFIII